MSSFYPEADPVLGNLAVRWIPTVVDLDSIDLSSEWNAVGAVDLSCFLRPFSPSGSESSGSAPNRICTTITLPQRGRTEISAFDLRYVYKTQEDDADPANAAKAALDEGAEGVLVLRKGIAYATAAAVGDHYEAWSGSLGRQNRITSGDDDFAEFEISQMFYPSADVVYGVLVA